MPISVPLITGIKRLRMACAVLHLGAHPDDEDAGMIAYLTHRIGARVVYWSATRGEGGQNRRGSEKGDALGVVRTWESLDARGFDGGEVLFGPFRDFGFSKSGEQTLERWGRDAVVREIVRAIRLVQPDVVVCRWNGDAQDGHGHHQAVGAVAREAFEAAAVPSRYSDLASQGLDAWRARTLFRSLSGDWQPGEPGEFGRRIEAFEGPGYVRFDSGTFDPVLECTYQELAVASLNCHVTQGMNFVPPSGSFFHYFREEPLDGVNTSFADTFFDGTDPTLTGLADACPPIRSALASVRASVETALDAFRIQAPVEAGVVLAGGLSVLRGATQSTSTPPALRRYLARRCREFVLVIARCFGLRAECLVSQPHLTPSSVVGAVLRLSAAPSSPVKIIAHHLEIPDGWAARLTCDTHQPAGGEPIFEARYELAVPSSVPPGTPYWMQQPSTPYRYAWPDVACLGDPFDPPILTASFVVEADGHRFEVETAACHRDGMQGGFRELAVSVLPSIVVTPRQRTELFPRARADRWLALDATVQCLAPSGAEVRLTLSGPEHFSVEPRTVDVSFARAGESKLLLFQVRIPETIDEGVYRLCFSKDDGTPAVECRAVRIGPPGAVGPVEELHCTREVFSAEPAVVDVHVIAAEFVPHAKTGYIAGLDEAIVPSLAHFGLELSFLNDKDLSFADLGVFDTVVVGPNAYLRRNALRRSSGALLDYVAGGGVVVVQYQGYGFPPTAAPYPFEYAVPHDRVTMPDAPVEILDGEHALLSFPNAITQRDFDGWIADRGLYFFSRWDTHYSPLLAAHDAGEAPRLGGYLVAPHGRGVFVYVAYSLFRQIPAGVPGAVRIFANLLGLAEARIRQRMALLESTDLLRSLSHEQLYAIARVTYERHIDEGVFLAREGKTGTDLFIPLQGRIDIVKHGPTGDHVLRHAAPGEAIGEFAMLANIPRSASLRAATSASVLVLPAKAFKDLLRTSPELSLRVMDMLVRKIITQNGGPREALAADVLSPSSLLGPAVD